MQCRIRCIALSIFVRQQTREEKGDVPKLRISLQLQHRGVCVPLQRPDVTNRGSKRGHACLQTDSYNTRTDSGTHVSSH